MWETNLVRFLVDGTTLSEIRKARKIIYFKQCSSHLALQELRIENW